jgi:hypothetical protein
MPKNSNEAEKLVAELRDLRDRAAKLGADQRQILTIVQQALDHASATLDSNMPRDTSQPK